MQMLGGENTTRSSYKLKDVLRLGANARFLLSWLHMNIEPLMKLGGRADLHVQHNLKL